MNFTLFKPFTKVLSVIVGFVLLINTPAADPANGDYTLRPDAPVYAFSPERKPLPVAHMGRVSE